MDEIKTMKKILEIQLDKFIDIKERDTWLESMQGVSEYMYDWFIDMDSGAYGSLEDNYYYSEIGKAYSYIAEKTGLSLPVLQLHWKDEIEDDFKRALDNAYRVSYEDEWLTKFYAALQERIQEALGDFYNKAYLYYYDKDVKKAYTTPVSTPYNKSQYGFEATTIRIPVTKKELLMYLSGTYARANKNMPWDELADMVTDDINYNIQPVNREYIDYYGQLGDSDNWLEYFKDYEETSALIKEAPKAKDKSILTRFT